MFCSQSYFDFTFESLNKGGFGAFLRTRKSFLFCLSLRIGQIRCHAGAAMCGDTAYAFFLRYSIALCSAATASITSTHGSTLNSNTAKMLVT